MRPHRRKPTRLPHPWDSPGKNTGVGCHCLLRTPYTEINSKWIKNLNVRSETIKLLEENIGKTLSDINHIRILYDPPLRVMEIKAKINKWDLIKLKSFWTTKKL